VIERAVSEGKKREREVKRSLTLIKMKDVVTQSSAAHEPERNHTNIFLILFYHVWTTVENLAVSSETQ